MSIVDWVRGLFGRRPSAPEYGAGAVTAGAVVAATSDDEAGDVGEQSDAGGFGGESAGGWDSGADAGDGGDGGGG